MNKKHLIYFTLIYFFFSILPIHSQWRYPNHKELKNDIVITYKVEYHNELTEDQKKSSRFKKQIIVIFNQDKLIEKSIKNTKGSETFYLHDYNKEKEYKCYKSLIKKEAIVRNFKVPIQKPIKVEKKSKKILGFNTELYTILVGDKLEEIITTRDVGLRYIKYFNVEGFLLKYFSKDKKLGPYTVTATKINYTKLPDHTYSLDGFLIRSDKEYKRYLVNKNAKRERVKEKAVKKINTKAPSYNLKSISGKSLQSKKMKHKIVVFSFFFTTSDASRRQIPQLNELKKIYKNKKIEFIAVALDEEYKVHKFLKMYPFNYEIIEDGKWIAKKFDIDLFPTNIIIDKKGKIQYYKTSYKEDLFKSMSFSLDKLLKN